jgi:hypothetical protein
MAFSILNHAVKNLLFTYHHFVSLMQSRRSMLDGDAPSSYSMDDSTTTSEPSLASSAQTNPATMPTTAFGAPSQELEVVSCTI